MFAAGQPLVSSHRGHLCLPDMKILNLYAAQTVSEKSNLTLRFSKNFQVFLETIISLDFLLFFYGLVLFSFSFCAISDLSVRVELFCFIQADFSL